LADYWQTPVASMGPPRREGSRRKRCGALNRQLHGRKGPICKQWAMTGKTRCRMHGGASTGPRTVEGKARVVAAMVDGRCKWIARLRDEGKPAPCGRKKGAEWMTVGMARRAFAEARRLGAEPADVQDCPLVLILVRSAGGDVEAEMKARQILGSVDG
jgi:hypothetical protein